MFTSPKIKEALLKIKRGTFVPYDLAEEAYFDRPLRTEMGFNISAPHMYAFCLQTLDIRAGQTFLDVGSGCGHMTALGAYLVGPTGKAHGLEILDEAILSSKKSVKALSQQGLHLANLSFEKRNVFIADYENRRWDRIHVGASCPQKEKHKLYELLNPGGILVMPIGSIFIKAEKDPKGMTKETKLLDVRYGELILPTPAEIAEAERVRAMQVVLPESSINSDYCKMFNNPFLSDVRFIVEGKPLYGHKAILASRSEYYASLYNSGMREATANEMLITNYSYDAFFEILKFIYTDQCHVHPHVAAELMSASEFYRLARLKAITEYTLSRSIDIENACTILEIAHSFSAHQLKLLVHEFIFQNYDLVTKTNGFSDMNKDCITEILHVAVQKMQKGSL
uniref:protein-L-isoaspartate(D-aspartate) O-methyltransferase n=1 Tax=Arcella intermedia TaxID=1963864 RepID=A0A6B2L5S9_9EUKA